MRDAGVLNDLRAFEVIKGVPRIPDRRSTDASGNKRHGDAGVALLLADFASRSDVVPMEFEALGVRRASNDLAGYDGASPFERSMYRYGA